MDDKHQHQLVRRETPEGRELAAKQAELENLQEETAQRELELATLQVELRDFEVRYRRTVGVRYAELDELNAQIAEMKARQNPDDATTQKKAAEAREQADETSRQAHEAGDAKPRPRFKPPEELKKVYKEAVRRFHPDATLDPKEKNRRHLMMIELNAAYEKGDEARISQILREWENSPDAVQGDDVAAELIRAIRKIAQVRERLLAIDAQMEELCGSDIWALKAKADEAEKSGGDLLEQMAAAIDKRIAAAKSELLAGRKTPPTNDAYTCQNCGTINPPIANYCMSCGTRKAK